jgi:hypothetical protein
MQPQMDTELLIDGFEADEVSLSFTEWTIDEINEGVGLRDFKVTAGPYYGELGPERVTPMELAVTLPAGAAWHGTFFHQDCGDRLHLVVAGELTKVFV